MRMPTRLQIELLDSQWQRCGVDDVACGVRVRVLMLRGAYMSQTNLPPKVQFWCQYKRNELTECLRPRKVKWKVMRLLRWSISERRKQ